MRWFTIISYNKNYNNTIQDKPQTITTSAHLKNMNLGRAL